ncbi:hypothetical protein [Streptomyces sp. H39-S7]|uniref:hypothetical protein n=1 Tax=Streptomyces sp. H39-S7 TaxID=3004357 RepID=UPI0022AE74A0|nr:hypothetical protein [Streptomyces sp. H39-S7]MCZ4119059.1 hypothetical protein [Streptomyces sp. H39-S7]
MSVAVEDEITLSEAIRSYTSQNYSYGDWHFFEEAGKHGWSSIGMIVDLLGSPVSSETHSRSYYGPVWEYARSVANAERIVELLDAVDEKVGEPGYAYGPGSSFIYDANNVLMVEAVESIEGALSDGCLNEDRADEIEYEENHPSETECYSDNPDCGCRASNHEHAEELASAFEFEPVQIMDGEWFCDFCSEWIEIAPADWERMAAITRRLDREDKEAKGQIVLSFSMR